MNILDEIIAAKRIEVEETKKTLSLDTIVCNSSFRKGKSFQQSLIESPFGIIAEFKRKSPSKGWIFEKAKIEDVVPEYAQAGASAISILTNKPFFGGSYDDLRKARAFVDIPLLNKDFIVDEYQLYMAKSAGADVVLLIAAALTCKECYTLAAKAKELGLEVLLEVHSYEEIAFLNEHIDVIGVNNRNLTTFKTEIQLSFDLAKKIPANMVKIAESGIMMPEVVKDLKAAGFNGFLIGERLMMTHEPGNALRQLISDLNKNKHA